MRRNHSVTSAQEKPLSAEDDRGRNKTKSDVLLNVPNTIGYVRAVLFTLGIWCGLADRYVIASSMYFVNYFILDNLDGILARRLGQCTKLGAMLDSVLDMAQIIMWKTMLCRVYPQYAFWISLQAAFTMGTEWLRSYTNELCRKKCDNTNPILKFYFSSFEFWIHTGWCFWLVLYITKYTQGPIVPGVGLGIWQLLLYITLPLSFFRGVVVMLVKIITYTNALVEYDIMPHAPDVNDD